MMKIKRLNVIRLKGYSRTAFAFALFNILTFQPFNPLTVHAVDRFVFSADGVTVGSSERELPSQGYDRVTGRVVVEE